MGVNKLKIKLLAKISIMLINMLDKADMQIDNLKKQILLQEEIIGKQRSIIEKQDALIKSGPEKK